MKENEWEVYRDPDGKKVEIKTASGDPREKELWSMPQFKSGLVDRSDDLEKNEFEKWVIKTVDIWLEDFLKEEGLEENWRDFPAERVHIIPWKKDLDFSHYNGYSDHVGIIGHTVYPDEYFARGVKDEIKDKQYQYDKLRFIISVLHERIHSVQTKVFLGLKNNNDSSKNYFEARKLSINEVNLFQKEGWKKDQFRGVVEFLTDLVVHQVLSRNENDLSEMGLTQDYALRQHNASSLYFKKYEKIMKSVRDSLVEEFNLDGEEAMKIFTEASIKGFVDRKYLRFIREHYGKSALRVLSYMESKFSDDIQKNNDKIIELVEEYFLKDTAAERREVIGLMLETYTGKFQSDVMKEAEKIQKETMEKSSSNK